MPKTRHNNLIINVKRILSNISKIIRNKYKPLYFYKKNKTVLAETYGKLHLQKLLLNILYSSKNKIKEVGILAGTPCTLLYITLYITFNLICKSMFICVFLSALFWRLVFPEQKEPSKKGRCIHFFWLLKKLYFVLLCFWKWVFTSAIIFYMSVLMERGYWAYPDMLSQLNFSCRCFVQHWTQYRYLIRTYVTVT